MLCLIAFGFYWGFKKPYTVPRTNPQHPDVIYSKYTKNVEGFQDADFEVVDLNKVYKGQIPYTAYLQSDPFEGTAS